MFSVIIIQTQILWNWKKTTVGQKVRILGVSFEVYSFAWFPNSNYFWFWGWVGVWPFIWSESIFFNQLVCWCGNVIFSYDRQEVLISWVAASTVSYIYKDTTLSSKRENTTNWMWWKYKFFAKFMIILKSCVIHFFGNVLNLLNGPWFHFFGKCAIFL